MFEKKSSTGNESSLEFFLSASSSSFFADATTCSMDWWTGNSFVSSATGSGIAIISSSITLSTRDCRSLDSSLATALLADSDSDTDTGTTSTSTTTRHSSSVLCSIANSVVFSLLLAFCRASLRFCRACGAFQLNSSFRFCCHTACCWASWTFRCASA
jgi:hypothetical protein